MSLHEPHHTRANDYAQRLLDRLHREVIAGSSIARSFAALCDVVSIPRDLQGKLLDDLVALDYVTREGRDRVQLTARGTQMAGKAAPQEPGRRRPGRKQTEDPPR
jgi:hypothetical protein